MADNTSSNLKMFDTSSNLKMFAYMAGDQGEESDAMGFLCIYIRCCVHVMDPAIEDICKIPQIAAVIEGLHFLVSFVRIHALIYEEFLSLQIQRNVCFELKLFPATRFACAYQMCWRIFTNWYILSEISGTTIFKNHVQMCFEG